MPELPEVETVRRHLQACVVGRTIARVEAEPVRLRAPVDVVALRRLLTGARVGGVRRRAKYLLVDLAPAPGAAGPSATLLVHLGMSGRVRWHKGPFHRWRHDHLVLHTTCGHTLAYHDPRRFGLLEPLAAGAEAQHPRLVGLGVEPLDPQAFDGSWIYARTRGRAGPIKAWLMNAAEVVGVGNIYASEALYAAGLRPTRRAQSLSRPACGRLAAATVQVLRAAIACGGTTLRDFAGADGRAGLFLPQLQVYGRHRQPCCGCARPLRRRLVAGRSTFYCSHCQR